MIVRLRRIGTGSVFLVALTLYGIVGFLVGIILAVVSTLELPPGSEVSLISRIGLWSPLVFPVLYGLAGGLSAAVAAALYNAAASVAGGIRVEIPELDGSGAGSAAAQGGEVQGAGETG